MIMVGTLRRVRSRAGITLTEILIAILILAVGLVSLATLFPLGLLRLRDANRYTRSAYLLESAVCDANARGLFIKQGFQFADALNVGFYPTWYTTPASGGLPNQYDPFTQDTPSYGANTTDTTTNPPTNGVSATRGSGLPFAYDPLWRYQTGIYLDPLNTLNLSIPEARFGSGIGFIRPDPFDAGTPSAWGLQRLTNFNRPTGVNGQGNTVPLMPSAAQVPLIFVSPEDVVWQESANQTYSIAGNAITTTANVPYFNASPGTYTPAVGSGPSPVVPDLNVTFTIDSATGKQIHTYQQTNDFRYSWMFTGQQTNTPITNVSTNLGQL